MIHEFLEKHDCLVGLRNVNLYFNDIDIIKENLTKCSLVTKLTDIWRIQTGI